MSECSFLAELPQEKSCIAKVQIYTDLSLLVRGPCHGLATLAAAKISTKFVPQNIRTEELLDMVAVPSPCLLTVMYKPMDRATPFHGPLKLRGP